MEEQFIPHRIVNLIEGERILVLAPHPDDEIFGCGGALMHYVAAGKEVRVVIVTDGGYGVDATLRSQYVAQRQEESRQASKIIGCGEPQFLGHPDHGLSYSESLVQELQEIIERCRSDLVFAPSLMEIHPDHRALAMSTIEAVRRLGTGVRLALYEVGAPGRPNTLVDITSVQTRKQAAMRCFGSQLLRQRHDLHMESLNKYRTYALPGTVEAVEAFEVLEGGDIQRDFMAILASDYRRSREAGVHMLGHRDLPLVSILIRSLDRSTLDEALDSIAAQTYPNIEVVLVNAKGASHQALSPLGHPVQFIDSATPVHRSIAANRCLEAARGELLLFLDDDDYIAPDHVAGLVSVMLADASLVAAYSGVVSIDPKRRPLEARFGRTFDPVLLLARNYMPIHSVLFSRRVVSAGCRFDEQMDVLEDWDFWIQASQLGAFRYWETDSAFYRIAPGSGWGVNNDAERSLKFSHYLEEKWRPLLQGRTLSRLMEAVRGNDDQAQQLRALKRNFDRDVALIQEERQWLGSERTRIEEERTRIEDGLRSDLAQLQAQLALSHKELRCRHDQIEESRQVAQRDEEFKAGLLARLAQKTQDGERLAAQCAALSSRLESIEPLEREYPRLLQERADLLKAHNEELARLLQAHQEECAHLRQAHHDERISLLTAQHHLNLERNKLLGDRDALLASTSWQLTAPLRKLIAVVRPAPQTELLDRAPTSSTIVPETETHPSDAGSTVAEVVPQAVLVDEVVSSETLLASESDTNGAAPEPTVVEAMSQAALVEEDVPSEVLVPPEPDIKEKHRQFCQRALSAFLRESRNLRLTQSDAPKLSIIIVLYNQAALTLQCLQSLADNVGIEQEIIIVDNASTDETPELLRRVFGIQVISNTENVGFLKAVNLAAASARGEYLLLLNNDTEVFPGVLRQAINHMAQDSQIGALGGRILLLDGTLQEAGNIVWQDGSCLGYGRGAAPDAAPYRFQRDVDYCSGAFLLTRTQLFRDMQGFDEAYAPAYYEETDYCLRLWKAGYRVVFDPAVVIRHFEFGSQNKPEKAIRMQERNRAIFVERHQDYLLERPLNGSVSVHRARQVLPKGALRVLCVDDRVPYPSMGSGYPRAAAILQTLIAAGHQVSFYPMTSPEDDWTAIYRQFPSSLEVIMGSGQAGLEKFARERRDSFDVVFISRPHNMNFIEPYLGEGSVGLGKMPVVYDAEALFSLRDFRQADVLGNALDPLQAYQRLENELRLARMADRVSAVSAAEALRFTTAGCTDVRVIGHALHATPSTRPFAEREGILFVGALDDDGSPNVDSVLWFVKEVLPLFHALICAEPPLILAGRAACPSIQLLQQSDKIRVLGRVEDISTLYDEARLFIVPTRFAGGIPHKAHEAAAYGIPMVTTSLIAGQLGWNEELLVADTPLQFAKQCAAIYTNSDLWASLRERALQRVVLDCDAQAFQNSILDAVRFDEGVAGA